MSKRTPNTPTRVSFATRLENTIDRHSGRVGDWLLRRTRGRMDARTPAR